MIETMRNHFSEFGAKATITRTDGPSPMSIALDVISFDEVGIVGKVAGMKLGRSEPIMMDVAGEVQCFPWSSITTLRFGHNLKF